MRRSKMGVTRCTQSSRVAEWVAKTPSIWRAGQKAAHGRHQIEDANTIDLDVMIELYHGQRKKKSQSKEIDEIRTPKLRLIWPKLASLGAKEITIETNRLNENTKIKFTVGKVCLNGETFWV